MNITIQETEAYERAIEFNQLYWKAYASRVNRTMYFCLFLGLAFLCYDIINFDTPSWIWSAGSGETPLNLHLGLGIGITLLYLIYFMWYRRQKEKRKFMSSLFSGSSKLYGPSNTRTIIINDEGISIESITFKYQVTWPILSSFIETKNFLVIYQSESSINSIYIYKGSFSKEDYETLLSFLRKSLKEMDEGKFPYMH